jgi:protein O-mannosyl-transferase
MPSNVWPKAIPLLILAGLCAYSNCISKTLVFDDDAWIVDQPLLDDPNEYFKAMEGRPLLALTNVAMHRLGRNNPVGHHVLNVFIHLAATLTLYGLVRRTLLLPRFHGRYDGRAPYLAFAVALLWMLHPLQVQSVTYIIQRGESMAGLFYLLMLYAVLRGNEVGAAPFEAVDAGKRLGLRRCGWYALAVVSLVLGFGSKETMATAPVALVLFDRIFLTRSIGHLIRRRWVFYLFFLVTWGMFTGFHVYRAVMAAGGIGFGMETLTWKQYALTEAGALLYYLQITFWPRGLAIDYQSWPWCHTLSDAMPEGAIVAAMLLATVVFLFWRPALGFVCAWFFIILAPTSSILPIADAVFEHRMYLSLATPVVLTVFFVDWALRRTSLTVLGPYLLTAAALALGILTFLRNEEYRSRAAVWQVAVERMPESVRARANFGQGLLVEGRNEEVVPILERALELAAHDPTSLQNLAAAYEQLGNFAAAADCYRRLCGFFPNDAKYWRMYGAALLVIAKWEEAEEASRRGIELEEKLKADKPDSPQQTELRYGRAAALYELGRDAEAEEMIREAFKLDPDWPDGVLALARNVMLDEKMRKSPDAVRSAFTWARLGLRFKESPQPIQLDTMGLCYAARGEYAKAAEHSRWALLIAPGGPWGGVHRDRLKCYEKKRVPWDE